MSNLRLFGNSGRNAQLAVKGALIDLFVPIPCYQVARYLNLDGLRQTIRQKMAQQMAVARNLIVTLSADQANNML